MVGGEIFIQKNPSTKITDIAKAINKNKKQKIVGVRPGEKIHETMCSVDESGQVLIFKDFISVSRVEVCTVIVLSSSINSDPSCREDNACCFPT